MSDRRRASFLLPFLTLAVSLAAQQYPASLLSGLEWRNVGPMRGGRTYAVAGIPSQPDTFLMGAAGGGLWKTENSGRTWVPIADDPVTGIPSSSIGAIAVAPSDPNIIYVGTGEPDIRSQHNYGLGVFKSTDAGKTWSFIGLKDSSQIGGIVVDPADPNRVYVAALGHVYKANNERGVYRSSDGGAHWKKILWNKSDPDNVGAFDLALDPKHPRTIYASLGHAPPAVGRLRAIQHARQRALEIHRRRRLLASAHQRPSQRWLCGQDRDRRCAVQSQPPLRRRRRPRRGDCAFIPHGGAWPQRPQALRRHLRLR